jgi:hypothetical protein
MMTQHETPNRRWSWDDIPPSVQKAITDRVEASLVSTETPPGGFTPGVAARALLSDGRRCFLKAACASSGDWVLSAYRHEAFVNAHLPPSVPAPRLWSYLDDGEWVCLIFDDVPGRFPFAMWEGDDLTRVLDALDRSAQALTPNPMPKAPTVLDAFATILGSTWERLQDDPRLVHADPWAAEHSSALTAMEAHWADGVQGDTLLHLDIRRDNILLTPTEVWFVDWAWPAVGAAWLDLACLLPTVAGRTTRHDVNSVFLSRRVGRNAPPPAVDAFLAALAGYWRSNSFLPDPPYSPMLRKEQRLAADGAIRWLRKRSRRELS